MLAFACGGDDAPAETDATGSGSSTTEGDATTTGGPDTTTGETTANTGDATSSSSSSSVDDTTTTGGNESSSGESESSSGGSESSSGGSESSSGEGMAVLEVTVSDLQIFQDCMPIISPDPVQTTLTLDLTNVGDVPASATVVSASYVDAGGVSVGMIDLAPMMLGPVPVGESAVQALSKVADSLMPANGCGVLSCNESYTLVVELDVDGEVMQALSMPTPADCVF